MPARITDENGLIWDISFNIEKSAAEAEKRIKEMSGRITAYGKKIGNSVQFDDKGVTLNYRKLLDTLNGSLSENQKTLNRVKSELKSVELSKKAAGKAAGDMTLREIELRKSVSDLTGLIRLQQRELVSEAGSVDQLRAKLTLLTRAYNSLGSEQRKTRMGAAIMYEAKQTTEALKTMEGAIGNNTRKVGDYEGAMTKALKGTWNFAKYISYLIPGLGIAGLFDLAIEGLKALWQEIQNGNNALSTFKRNVEITAEALKDSGYIDAKAKVAELKEELKLATEGKISAIKAIDDYNESLGRATGGVASLGEMENKLASSAEAYLQMLKLKTKATIAYQKAAQEGVLADIEMNEYGQFGSAFMRFLKTPSEWFKSPVPGKIENPFQVQIDYADSKRKSETLLNKLGDDYQKQAAEVANKFKLNFFNDTEIQDGQSIAHRVYQDTKQLKDLLDEIASSKEKYQIEFGPKFESEQLKIDNYFDALTKKVDDFNKDPNRKLKLTPEQINTAKAGIESGRKYALGLAEDKESGDHLIKQLAEQKKLYKEYEDFRAKYGEQAADELYGNLTGKYKTYLDRVQAEYDKLEKKGATGLNPAEADLFSGLTALLAAAKNLSQSDQTKWLSHALADYQSFQQKRLAITEHYNEEVKKAETSGQYDLIDGIENARQNALAKVDADNVDAITRTKGVFDDVVLITTEAVKQQIESIEYLLKNAELTPDQRSHLTGKLDFTKSLLNLNVDDRELAQINKDIEDTKIELQQAEQAGVKTAEALEILRKKLRQLEMNKAAKELDVFSKKLAFVTSIAGAVGQLGNVLSDLGDTNPELSALGSTLTSLASSIGDLAGAWDKLAKGTLNGADKFQLAANFIINTISDIAKSVQQNRLTEAQYLQDVIAYQHGYNLALLEEQRIKSDMKSSIFHIDSLAKIKGNLKQQIDLVNEYNEAMGELENGMVKVGTMKAKRDWAAVGGATLAGAGTGAIVGATGAGVLSVPGAIIGGIVGFVGGLLKKRQVVDVYDNLLKVYPDLIDEEGRLNDARAKSLLTSNLLDAKTKETLQYVTELQQQYKEAEEAIKSVVEGLIGDVGNNIMNELVDNFRNGGENAGEAFRRGFAKSLENLYSDLIYSAILGPELKKLEERIKSGFAAGDDEAMQKALYEFLDNADSLANATNKMIEDARNYAASKGIDIYGPDGGNTPNKNRNTISGAISSASQESIDLLSGHTMGMRVAQLQTNEILTNGFAESFEVANRSLDNLVKIERNTYNTVQELKSLNNKIQSGSDIALAMGGTT